MALKSSANKSSLSPLALLRIAEEIIPPYSQGGKIFAAFRQTLDQRKSQTVPEEQLDAWLTSRRKNLVVQIYDVLDEAMEKGENEGALWPEDLRAVLDGRKPAAPVLEKHAERSRSLRAASYVLQ